MRRLITWGNQLSIQKFTVFSFIPVLLFRVLFIITYPLANIATHGGDTTLYFNNILEGKASLVNATGYPFLMGLLWRIEPLKHKLLNHPLEFTYLVLFQQHVIDLISLLVFFITLYLIFNRWTAMLSTWIYGMDVIWGVSSTSATNPQWLQSVFLVISLAAAYRAWSIKTTNSFPSWFPVKLNTIMFRKTFWYSISMIAFVWCYLTKFNAVVLVLFYAFFFLCRRLKYLA